MQAKYRSGEFMVMCKKCLRSNFRVAARMEISMNDNRVVLCGANAYEQKYYFNEQFNGIPDSIKDELHIICVLFTEEVGGIFTIVFEEDGTLSLETNAEEDDIYYDEISSGLLIGEIRKKRQDLLEALGLYYRVFILKEDVSALLDEDGMS